MFAIRSVRLRVTLGLNENRDQSSLRSRDDPTGHTAHGKSRSPVLHSDPRRAGAFQAAAVNLTAERPGKISLKSLLSVSRVQLIWRMRRAMMVIAKLAFLPRARCYSTGNLSNLRRHLE